MKTYTEYVIEYMTTNIKWRPYNEFGYADVTDAIKAKNFLTFANKAGSAYRVIKRVVTEEVVE